jgi:hypothetical protein
VRPVCDYKEKLTLSGGPVFCGVSRGGTGDATPIIFLGGVVRWGRHIFVRRFHSTIVVDIHLGRYRSMELSATFDDKPTCRFTCSSKLYMTSFSNHDLLENWLRNVIELCHMLLKHFQPTATMETHSISQ